MSLWMFYTDESHDRQNFVLSAIAVRHSHWRKSFDVLKSCRESLRDRYGMRISKEIHAYKFVRGKGRSISSRIMAKQERCDAFLSLLQATAAMPFVRVFNVCLPVSGRRDPELDAWDRLVNRIERFCVGLEKNETPLRARLYSAVEGYLPDQMRDGLSLRLRMYHPRAIVIADEGREREIAKTLRKMRVFNLIPSQFGAWETGERSKNIVTRHIIEDVWFKPSHRSYFIQAADCAAYALLKRETQPTPHVLAYDIHKMWDQALAKVAHKPASKDDDHGIVRR